MSSQASRRRTGRQRPEHHHPDRSYDDRPPTTNALSPARAGRAFQVVALALVAGLVALSAALVGPTASEAQPAVAKQKGANFVAYWPGVYQAPEAHDRLERLVETGADWVSILVFNFQDGLDSTDIGPAEGTETDDDLRSIIDHAHGLGLQVMLRPMVDVAGQCRCRIGQGFTTEAQWDDWFTSYRQMLYPYAELAAQTDVEQFSVGAELEQTTGRESQWRSVIAGVRARYDGPLVYGAQHSGPELTINWWDAVDFIGVDAYYPVANQTDPTAAQLTAAWAGITNRLEALSQQWDRPIIFTEAGFSNIDGTNQTPWALTNGRPRDDQEQAMAYEAMFDAVWDEPWFAGVHLWEWFANPSIPGGICNIGHVYIDKPAENVVRSYFGAPPLEAPVPSTDPADRQAIYTDELAAAWVDGSWNLNTPTNPGVTDPVATGQYSYGVDIGPWGAMSLIAPSVVSSDDYSFVSFKIRAATANPPLQVGATGSRPDRPFGSCMIGDGSYTNGQALAADTWVEVTVPLRDLGVDDQSISRFTIRNQTGTASAKFWIDDMYLLRANGTEPPVTTTTEPPATTTTSSPAPTTTTTEPPATTTTTEPPVITTTTEPPATTTTTQPPVPTTGPPATTPCGTIPDEPSYSQIATIYDDRLADGWRNDSWSATVDDSATTSGQSGTNAIAVELNQWGAWSVSSAMPAATDGYRWLELFIKGSEEDVPLAIRLNDAAGQPRVMCDLSAVYVEQGDIGTNFTRVVVPLAALDLPSEALSRISVIYRSGVAGPTIWIDNVRLIS